MIYFLTLHLQPWWKYLQEIFFFVFSDFFFLLRPVLQLHTSKTCSPALKAEPLLQELSPHFQKSHIIECFFNMVAVSKHLGTAFRARPLPTVGSGWSKKKRHLKLNLKMCFSWKPGRAAINRRRHFHAPHFSWFLPEFPPFLPRSTLAPQLPTAALAADHDQQGIIGGSGGGGEGVEGGGCSSSLMEPGQKFCLVDLPWLWWTSCLDSIDLRRLSPPFTSNVQPENSEPMANSNQSGAWSPPTHRPGFNVATKENILMQAADCSPGPTLCATCYNLWRAQRFGINWGCETVRLPAHVCSGQLHWVMHTVCVCGWKEGGRGFTVALWSPTEIQTQKRGYKMHFYFTWAAISSKFSACGLQAEHVFSPSFKSIWCLQTRERELGAGFQEHRFSYSLGEGTRINVWIQIFLCGHTKYTQTFLC